MRIPVYHVDAFTSEVFSGNPAAVCLLDRWLDDKIFQALALENNLSDTAFLVPNAEGFDLRWFTPFTEVALCGHATLASAFVLFHCQDWPGECIRFRTCWSGELVVTWRGDLLEMDFPAIAAHIISPPAGLTDALSHATREGGTLSSYVHFPLASEQCSSVTNEKSNCFYKDEAADYRFYL